MKPLSPRDEAAVLAMAGSWGSPASVASARRALADGYDPENYGHLLAAIRDSDRAYDAAHPTDDRRGFVSPPSEPPAATPRDEIEAGLRYALGPIGRMIVTEGFERAGMWLWSP